MVSINRSSFGRGVRYGEEAGRKQATETALRRLLSPSQNITNEVLGEVGKVKQLNPEELKGYREKSYATYPKEDFGAREVDWLAKRAANANLAIDGINEGKELRLNFIDNLRDYSGKRVLGLAIPETLQNRIQVSNDFGDYHQLRSLSHELGHAVAGHLDLRRNTLPELYKEAEAEIIGVGIQNRLYPWQRRPARIAGDFINKEEKFNVDTVMEDGPVDKYLSKPEVQSTIDQVIRTIVPKPRQPFNQMIPGLWEQPKVA